MPASIQQQIVQAAIAKEAAKNKDKHLKAPTGKVKFEKKRVLDKGPILNQFKYLLNEFFIPAVQAGIKHRGWKVDEKEFVGKFKKEFVEWVTSTADNWDGQTEAWKKFRSPVLKLMKKKTPAALYGGLKKALKILEDKVGTDHGDALQSALHYLREDVANGGDGWSVLTDLANRFGINPKELEYFWKKIQVQVQKDQAKADKEQEEAKAKEQEEAAKEKSKTKDGISDSERIVDPTYGVKPDTVIRYEKRMRGMGIKGPKGEPFAVEPSDWAMYLEDKPGHENEEAPAETPEQARKRKEQEKADKDARRELAKKVDARVTNLWKMMKYHMPRAFVEKLDEWAVVYDKDGTLAGGLLPKQMAPGAKARSSVIPDTISERFILPQQSHSWDTNTIKSKMIDAAVRAFFSTSGILQKKKLPMFFKNVFMTETDVDYLVELLNRISTGVDSQGKPILRTLLNKEMPFIESLQQEMAESGTNTEKLQKWQQWKAEHGDEFLAKLENKAMIPLFYKWVGDALKARVLNQRVPDSVPYPVIEFLNKLAAHEEIRQVAAAKIAEVRFELARTAPDEVEMDAALLHLHKKLKRRIANTGLNGLPKALKRTV